MTNIVERKNDQERPLSTPVLAEQRKWLLLISQDLSEEMTGSSPHEGWPLSHPSWNCSIAGPRFLQPHHGEASEDADERRTASMLN